MVPIISVIGFSQTGKTTFIGNMVKALHDLGYRAAVIKHDPIDHGDVDREGSDTSVFWNAGSPAVALSSPRRLTLFRRTSEDTHPESIVSLLGDVDCVVLEGYKSWSFPKIVIWSSKIKSFSINHDDLLAVVCKPEEESDVRSWVKEDVALFYREDIIEFAGFLVNKILSGN